MTSAFEFAQHQPLAAIIIVLIISYAATRPFAYGFQAYNRHLRSMNIRERGWPTAPIDADGDVVYPTQEGESA